MAQKKMPMATGEITLPAPQHICLVTETFPPDVNGVANTLRYLCQGLLARGHRVTLVRPRPASSDADTGSAIDGGRRFSIHNLAGINLPFYPEVRIGLPAGRHLRRLWSDDRPDAIYIATQGPLGWSALKTARRLKIRASAGFHTNFHQYCRYYGLGFLEPVVSAYLRHFHNRAERTLVPTRAMLNSLGVLSIRRGALWSRGVDCLRFDPARRSAVLRQEWGLGPDDQAVLYVGRLAAEKNLDQAVRTFEAIHRFCPGARMVLVGDGPLRPELKQAHPEYIFCGMRLGNELAVHYASGDLLLFPSKTDTFGNVVTEAMASGLPVIAYDDGAAAEHIETGINGMKAPLDEDRAYTRSALALIELPALRRQLGHAARTTALKLDWRQRTEEFESLIFAPVSEEKSYAAAQRLTTL